jgi:hypothetical protein
MPLRGEAAQVPIQQKWLTAAGALAVALAVTMPATPAAATRTAGAAGREVGPVTAMAPSAAGRRAVAADLLALSPQQLAGQRVIYSYPGLTPPASLISLVQHGEAAGVIFFGQNIPARRRSRVSSGSWIRLTRAR